MALVDVFGRLFKGDGHGVEELARRLDVSAVELSAARPNYRTFSMPKRSGGTRWIDVPEPGLKALQRRCLRRILARLRSHPNATGFERGHSIVTNAILHAGKAVVVRTDIRDFFPATRAGRVRRYFRCVGWNREAAGLLTRLCTYDGRLPQGAPTSPRLSNLVNYRMDARLAAMANHFGAAYTRYADDMTLSFEQDDRDAVHGAIRMMKLVLNDFGYRLHQRRKLQIRRRHQQQFITGLVVNARVNLPRVTRRRLRAIEHHLRTNRPATLTARQFAGWQALREMIAQQSTLPG